MLHKFKLKEKFFLTFFFIVIIPLACSTFWNFNKTRDALIEKTIASLKTINISCSTHINNIISLRLEQVRQLAGSGVIKRLKSNGKTSRETIRRIQRYLQTVYLELNKASATEHEHVNLSTDVGIIILYDSKGKMIANTNEALHEEMLDEYMPSFHFNQVRQKGAYFGGLHNYHKTGENYFFFNEKVLSAADNRFAGVLTYMVKADVINNITTARLGMGETGETYIVDDQYRMISESRFVKNAVFNQKVNTDASRACFMGRQTERIYENYLGVPVLGAQQYMPDQNWCLISEIEEMEAFAPVIELRYQTMMFSWIIMLGVYLFAIFFSRIFIKPIINLNVASENIAGGNYDVVLPKINNDEIGELVDAYNNMAQKLKAAKMQLEEKNESLRKNLEFLEKVNKELDRYVRTISHDIRSPLMGILGYTSLLEGKVGKKLNEKEREFLSGIFRSIEYLNVMIDDLLKSTKIHRVKNPYEKVSVEQLIGKIEKRLEFQIKRSNVVLNVQKGLPEIVCDGIKMGEVFHNLISNAIKFAKQNTASSPEVKISYRECEGEHEFCISDNGIGIDAKYHNEIFDMFMHINKTKEYAVNGVGLNLVKGIINDHGGRIWVESEPGQGASFYFTIPKDLKINKLQVLD